jgi:hypothetical protein
MSMEKTELVRRKYLQIQQEREKSKFVLRTGIAFTSDVEIIVGELRVHLQAISLKESFLLTPSRRRDRDTVKKVVRAVYMLPATQFMSRQYWLESFVTEKPTCATQRIA